MGNNEDKDEYIAGSAFLYRDITIYKKIKKLQFFIIFSSFPIFSS